MSELGAGSGTSYPTSLDTDNNQEVNSPNAAKTRARAEVINDLAAAIIAIETELGTSPKGSATNVKTFLQTQHNLDGTHKTISTNTLSATGQITSTVVTGTAPFVVASTTLVTNLNAQLLQGVGPSPTNIPYAHVQRDASGNFTAGTITANLTGAVTGNSTTATTANRVTDGTNNIRIKIINIGAWNMDATNVVNIAHGLTFSTIRGAEVLIYNDAGTTLDPFDAWDGVSGSSSGVFTIGATEIALSRTISAYFDNTDYNDGTMNRGFIIITYVE